MLRTTKCSSPGRLVHADLWYFIVLLHKQSSHCQDVSMLTSWQWLDCLYGCMIKYHKAACTSLSDGEHLVVRNMSKTILLTYSMVQSPSWEANWSAASQEIPRISRNPKVHYRAHKRPPPVPILGQPNPVHTPTSHLLEIHPNIIHPSTPRSPQWSLSLRFPHQDPIHPPLRTHTRHMPSPFHSSRFYRPHNIGWGVKII